MDAAGFSVFLCASVCVGVCVRTVCLCVLMCLGACSGNVLAVSKAHMAGPDVVVSYVRTSSKTQRLCHLWFSANPESKQDTLRHLPPASPNAFWARWVSMWCVYVCHCRQVHKSGKYQRPSVERRSLHCYKIQDMFI